MNYQRPTLHLMCDAPSRHGYLETKQKAGVKKLKCSEETQIGVHQEVGVLMNRRPCLFEGNLLPVPLVS